jgi:hypothetical protein
MNCEEATKLIDGYLDENWIPVEEPLQIGLSRL